MEAALWGNFEAVQSPLNNGANPYLKDQDGNQAIDLARHSIRNIRERQHRAKDGMEPCESAINRERIVALLTRPRRKRLEESLYLTTARRSTIFERMVDGSVEVHHYTVRLGDPGWPNNVKTFGELDRGANYPRILAMSGRSHSGWSNVLDNTIWSERAEEICEHLNMRTRLVDSGCTRIIDKKCVSHVEPQLLAYLLDHHTLHLWSDGTQEAQEKVRGLASVMPTYNLDPVITVSNKLKPCQHCEKFVRAFETAFPELKVTFRFGREIKTTRTND